MTEVKIVCGCGLKFKFDVEPVGGKMPHAVICPGCGADTTSAANEVIAHFHAGAPVPVAAGESRAIAIPAGVFEAPPGVPYEAPTRRVPLHLVKPKEVLEETGPNLPLAILGALIGAGSVAGTMIVIYEIGGFQFPWLGLGIGFLAGGIGRLFGRGVSNRMGCIAAGIAAAALVTAIVVMYGNFPPKNLISLVICAGSAYWLGAK